VIERGKDFGFALESREALGIGRKGVGKNLQRYVTFEA
jgi:hypothetical protein